jgi:alpha-beta hydrolase superfamily lysophospholipase
MKKLIPGLIQQSGLNINHISHDKTVVEKYKADPLVHDKVSVRLFAGALTAAKNSLTHASELKIPVLILHGSDDMITSPEGSREFAGKTNMVKLKIWDGGYHELHNEPFKDEVFKYIIDWIKS